MNPLKVGSAASLPLSVVAVAGSVCASALVVLVFAPAAAQANAETFTTPGCATWNVPANVSSVDIVAAGSAGETVVNGFDSVTIAGGAGAIVSGKLSGLSAGQPLRVCVNFGGGPGGDAGGVVDGGAGGGASGVALGSDFSKPVLIAAGGGGAGFSSETSASGGDAGLPDGHSGGDKGGTSAEGGGGGTQTTPGAGGAENCDPDCTPSSAGAQFNADGPGIGGTGGAGSVRAGGGGGAGYFGGGGGGSHYFQPAGGGGGSAFCATTLTGATLARCSMTGSNAVFGTAFVVLTATATECNVADATITGTQGDDVLVGTPGPDVIAGLGGDDILIGLGGDDIICGGDGNDKLKGGPGKDTLYGDAGRDKLKGGAGADTCTGGPQRDTAKKCEKAKQI